MRFSKLPLWIVLVAISLSAASFQRAVGLASGNGIRIRTDAAGNTYVASQNLTPADLYPNSPQLEKLDPDGSTLYQRRYSYPDDIGANGVTGIALDPSGSLWVAGRSVLRKLDAAGSILLNVSIPNTIIDALECDRLGNVFVAGRAVTPLLVTQLVILKFDPNGKALGSYSINAQAVAGAIAVDASGSPYIAGQTSTLDFPTTAGAFLERISGWTGSPTPSVEAGPAFVVKFSQALDRVIYSTLLGSAIGPASATSVAVDASGDLYVGGFATVSSSRYPDAAPFPLTQVGPLVVPYNDGTSAAFVTELNPAGSALIYSTALTGGDFYAMALGPTGVIYAMARLRAVTATDALVGLFRVDTDGSPTAERFLYNSILPSMDINILSADLLRILINTNAERFPVLVEDALTPIPYLVDFPAAKNSGAELSVSAVLVQAATYGTDVVFRATVRNDGSEDADTTVLDVNMSVPDADLSNFTADGVALFVPNGAIIPKLAPGAEINFEFRAITHQFLKPGSVQLRLFSQSTVAQNQNQATILSVPAVAGHSLTLAAGSLIYFRSDLVGPCDWRCGQYNSLAAEPAVTVTIPSPQYRDGNWWYFDSWQDGVMDNPRIFDTTADVPIASEFMNFRTTQTFGIVPTVDLVALPSSVPQPLQISIIPKLHTLLPAEPSMNYQGKWTIGTPSVPWLSLSLNNVSNSGVANVTVTADSTGLAPGYYTATFHAKLVPVTGTAEEMDVPVTLRIMDTGPTVSSIVDGAAYLKYIAQGQIFVISGTGLGPQEIRGALLPLNGELPTSLGGTRVMIGGTAAPLLYVQANQIAGINSRTSVLAPGPTTGGAVVEIGGTNALTAPIITNPSFYLGVFYNPTLFTSDSSGRGPLAAVNQDGSLNSKDNPAHRGSVVQIYGTGAGYAPSPFCDPTGFGSNALSRIQTPVEALVGTKPALVPYAGSSLNSPCALQQFDVVIPDDSDIGPTVPVKVRIIVTHQSFWSQDGVTISIQ